MSYLKNSTIKRKSTKYRDADKVRLIPTVTLDDTIPTQKPEWMRIKLSSDSERISHIKSTLRKHGLHSVCEEASCPNLSECFHHGTATFMIMGDICTRRCAFCDVAHGRPLPLDADEPEKLAKVIAEMQLKYVVITSVDRDDLKDGGARHFVDCVSAIRRRSSNIKIETLVPDFRHSLSKALDILSLAPPDVFNHNLENVPRLYKEVRLGASYDGSLTLLSEFKTRHPSIPTKSGLMVGLGETNEELIAVMEDLRHHGVTMLTVGQYLQPSPYHYPLQRYVSPKEFEELKRVALAMGFTHAACGPFVRSSYHADLQAQGKEVK